MCKKFIKKSKSCTKKKKRFKLQIPFSFSWLNTFLLLLIVVSISYYVMFANHQATAGYKMSDLEERIENLTKINKNFELTLIELQKIERIKQAALAQDMVAVEEVDYLVGSKSGLAKR